MKLDTEKLRKAGVDVLALRDGMCADQTAQGFIEAQSGLIGLSITAALAALHNDYKDFQGRFSGELDYLGNAVIAAASDVELTDEDGMKAIDSLDIPR
ncbi:hypothetical protein [Segniliparus rugosus]|uniref:Uncharacterized protein n=1 Tax=Segniliparus rugosus (strain ATCC BAA-974 / DSM 45345 / CCUG 50838 / CIP 108380 / JCM 13579 / CDC 945) TaxID=679197 RepID=E5XNN0_SEGRC|nr:hypothetical protein [Segniliparus rugosus]EFV14020.1 hypothetical protein HMPREF9336_01101 [Segniliparus rugosus ATCC BAA-974]